MEIAFYLAAIVAIIATLGVVMSVNPVHALLNLIISLIAIAMVFFALGAPLAGALEIIVYAGAIMVLFVFVVMMLNMGRAAITQERSWLTPGIWYWPAIMAAFLLGLWVVMLWIDAPSYVINAKSQSPSEVGMLLFGPYLIGVELAAFLLLAALISATHIGRSAKE